MGLNGANIKNSGTNKKRLIFTFVIQYKKPDIQ